MEFISMTEKVCKNLLLIINGSGEKAFSLGVNGPFLGPMKENDPLRPSPAGDEGYVLKTSGKIPVWHLWGTPVVFPMNALPLAEIFSREGESCDPEAQGSYPGQIGMEGATRSHRGWGNRALHDPGRCRSRSAQSLRGGFPRGSTSAKGVRSSPELQDVGKAGRGFQGLRRENLTAPSVPRPGYSPEGLKKGSAQG